MIYDPTALNQAQSHPIAIGDAPLSYRRAERDDAPPYDDAPEPVSYCDAVAICGPDLVSQIMSYCRHYEGDDGPYWLATELPDIANIITRETAGRAIA